MRVLYQFILFRNSRCTRTKSDAWTLWIAKKRTRRRRALGTNEQREARRVTGHCTLKPISLYSTAVFVIKPTVQVSGEKWTKHCDVLGFKERSADGKVKSPELSASANRRCHHERTQADRIRFLSVIYCTCERLLQWSCFHERPRARENNSTTPPNVQCANLSSCRIPAIAFAGGFHAISIETLGWRNSFNVHGTRNERLSSQITARFFIRRTARDSSETVFGDGARRTQCQRTRFTRDKIIYYNNSRFPIIIPRWNYFILFSSSSFLNRSRAMPGYSSSRPYEISVKQMHTRPVGWYVHVIEIVSCRRLYK